MIASPRAHRRSVTVASLLVTALLTATGAVPHVGRAQPGAVPRTLPGTWAHDGDPARAMRTVEGAFASSIAALPELVQGLARDRIRSSMQPPRRVIVSLDGPRVRVRLESDRTITVEGALGSRATVSGIDAGTRVTPRLQHGWLELLYEGEGSELRQLYSTEPDGSRMHVDFTVVNARLRAPVRYRLEYVRRP